jgi:alpha-beta hydrolase superfamily lysophospholipase
MYQEDMPGQWGSMQENQHAQVATEQIEMKDGARLFVRSWLVESPDVLLIMHGLGGHSDWYIDMGNEIASHSINVYAMDHRGFGRSDGNRGHITAYRTFVEDIAALISIIKARHGHAHIYILGHSMGGIFATYVAASYPQLLSGVIFLNPWVRDTVRLPMSMTLSILLGGMAGSQRLWQAAGGPEAMTANEEAIRMLNADPLWQRQLSATFLVQIQRMRSGILRQAERIRIPALVLQAEADRVVVPLATRQLYDRLSSTDKTWIGYPGYEHDSQFQHDRISLDSDIVSWIQKQSTAAHAHGAEL